MKTNCSSSLLQFIFGPALLLGLAKLDPIPLQNYCVADNISPQSLFINGVPCIDPNQVTPSHFATSALSKPGNTRANVFGSNTTMANTVNLPGLNTMGITISRIDIEENGIVALHAHPRASEVTTCLKGELIVGFVDTSYRLYSQKLRPGDSFVFPKGLIHFLFNTDQKIPALAMSGFNSQNPGVQITSIATFTTIPGIPDEILKKAYQINSQDVGRIRKNLGG
jgi:quercetin dioxygenase-like cupin family protein